MAKRVSVQQAVQSALQAWLMSKLPEDVTVSDRWPEPTVNMAKSAGSDRRLKTITILRAGPRQDEELQPELEDGRVVVDATHNLYVWTVLECKQPMQLDVWAAYDGDRDELMALLDEALHAGDETLGITGGDPVRTGGVLLAVQDGWSTAPFETFADFVFESAEAHDDPTSVQQSEYRATIRGYASFSLSVAAKSPTIASIQLRARVSETDAASVQAETTTVTADSVISNP